MWLQVGTMSVSISSGSQLTFRQFERDMSETKLPLYNCWCAGVPKNLLIQFTDDNIDQTPTLVATLEAASMAMSSSNSSKSQLTLRQLPGDHIRPLRQAFGDLPSDLAEVANQAVTQGSYFLQGLSNMATQAGFREVWCSKLPGRNVCISKLVTHITDQGSCTRLRVAAHMAIQAKTRLATHMHSLICLKLQLCILVPMP